MFYKHIIIWLCLPFVFSTAKAQTVNGSHGEKFKRKVVARNLSDPWEITYGPDHHLWITEAKSYLVSRINPKTGEKQVALNLESERKFPRYDKIPDDVDGGKPWPQGGLMGMALHPKLLQGKPYVYLAYIHKFSGAASEGKGEEPDFKGYNFTARLVCYEYNEQTGKLSKPVVLCDTIPASNDHNGGRLVIAPVNGKDYIFYAVGDLGAGQYKNGGRTNYAQDNKKYEGKILRFNVEPDNDLNTYDRWIPNDNPFNKEEQNAVWSIGHRNVQGIANITVGRTNFLYAAEHGPFSDDEINLIEKGKNYGHPLVIGYMDNNYNGFAAAVSDNEQLPGKWHTTYPLIKNEQQNAIELGADYRDPVKSLYPARNSFLDTIFSAVVSKRGEPERPAVAPSGMVAYTASGIPGWNNSLLLTSLKEGKLYRLKLNKTGNTVDSDTIQYFKLPVRYRDVTYSPDGKTIYLSTDSSTVTSGPSEEDQEKSIVRGGIISYTYESGGADLDKLEQEASSATNQRQAKSLLKNLVATIQGMDGTSARKVLFSPEMRLAVNLLV
ncbi:MAG: hypothetical protein EOO88_36955, partial [Pedobacter sp.]